MEKMLISKRRKVLTEEQLYLPGLKVFGHNMPLKAATPITMHKHEGCLEFVLIIKGSESYYADEQYFSLSGGDVFVSFENQPHSNGSNEQGVCEIYWFQINPSVEDNFLGISKTLADQLKAQLYAIDTHVLKADNECIMLLKRSFENFLKFDPESRLYAVSLFMNFLTRLLFIKKDIQKADGLILKSIEYVNENICGVLTIEELCSMCNISVSGYKHKFKKITGETPRDYINRRKIQKAKDLLRSKNSVTETAMKLSFNSSDYFSVVFKKYTNTTPTEYMKSLG